MNKNFPSRAIVTTKDIQLILKKCPRTASEIMRKLRKRFNKLPGQYISKAEFCQAVGLKEDDVKDYFT